MAAHLEFFVKSPDGLSLFVRDYAAVGPGRSLPVVCLHGLTRNSADFEAVAPRLAALGRRVIAPDMRGRGRSDRDPDPERYRPDVYVRDVIAILDAVCVDRAVFVGTSMGGIITMLAATVAPGRVAAAVLNDIGPVLDPAGLSRIAGYVGKSAPYESWGEIVRAIKATQDIAFPDADEMFWNIFARRVAHQLPDGRVAFAYDPAIANAFNRAPPNPAPDMMPMFQALAVRPILSVRGALSDLLSPEGVAAMCKVKPDMETVEVPRVGHAPTLEEPAAWRALEGFLDRLT